MKLLSNHPLQTFTPPTCTLKIWDRRSLLLRLKKPILLDDIESELLFDDPKLLIEDQIGISGNHSQLNLLYNIVQSYICKNLNHTASFITSQNSLADHYSLIDPDIKEQKKKSSKSDPYLFSDNLFTHNLVFGNLANNYTCSSVVLNSCQLFDLLSALEKYIYNITILTSRKRAFPINQLLTLNKKSIIIFISISFIVVGIKFYKTLRPKHIHAEKPLKTQENILSFLDVVPPVPPLKKPSLPPLSLSPLLSQLSTLSPPKRITGSILPLSKSNSSKIQFPLENRSNSSLKSNILRANENSIKNPSNIDSSSYSNTFSKYSRLPNPPILNQKNSVPKRDNNKTDKYNHFPALDNKRMNELPNSFSQLGEIQKYFQKRWKPLENLEQTIEYRLIIKSDGSLEKGIPLGHLAMVYRSQIPFPKIGFPFISPLKTLNNISIRLVLIPDGTVRTFLE